MRIPRRAAVGRPVRALVAAPLLSLSLSLAIVLGTPTTALAQADQSPTLLSGTLQKARQTGTVTLAYRESSIPFSFLSARGEPIGYSIDLCRAVVDAIGDTIGKAVAIRWLPVTSESRIAAVTSGRADLECGSTTSNVERRRAVGFSPTIFVSGTKLMVPKGSAIRSFRDLAGKRVVVTTGTTNEKTLQDLKAKFRLDFTLLTAPDHAASFRMLVAGQADAFATDDVLLYGLLAQNGAQADYAVVGEFLSYDPYGVMYRRDDPQLARLVDETFVRLAAEREIDRRYERWFLQKLPSGASLDLPMSPQLETIIQTMAPRPE